MILRINGQKLTAVVGHENIIADTINYLHISFTFTGDWDGLQKFARFISPDGRIIVREIIDGKIERSAGLNFTEGVWRLMVHGDEFNGGTITERITTNEVVIHVQHSAINDSGEIWDIDINQGDVIIARATEQAEFARNAAGNAALYSIEAKHHAESAGYALDQLKKGIEDGDFKGDDGFSPIAIVSKTGDTATITITDKNGTTSAEIHDGNTEDITPESIRTALGYTPANKSVVDNHTNELINHADDINDLERTTAELVDDVERIDGDVSSVLESIVDLQNGKQDKIEDLADIRSKANSALQSVPLASANSAGIVQFTDGCGVQVNAQGKAFITPAGKGYIDAKTDQYRSITPSNVDYATMKALSDPKNHTWTAEQQAAACETIGAERAKGEWVLKGVLTSANDSYSKRLMLDFSSCTELVCIVRGDASSELNILSNLGGFFYNALNTSHKISLATFVDNGLFIKGEISKGASRINSTAVADTRGLTYSTFGVKLTDLDSLYYQTTGGLTDFSAEIYAR